MIFAGWIDESCVASISECLRSVLRDLGDGVTVGQSLVSPDDLVAAKALADGGFRRITDLVYLRNSVSTPNHSCGDPTIEFVTFRDDRVGEFCAALLDSYVGSRDCPELAGLRSTPDVLAGHRGAGPFDASLWLLAKRGKNTVGVLLLSRIPANSALEIVYLGVAQPARGSGVGDALLARATAEARRVGANQLALAVDVRNFPARALYARWGFTPIMQRAAWIATLDGASG